MTIERSWTVVGFSADDPSHLADKINVWFRDNPTTDLVAIAFAASAGATHRYAALVTVRLSLGGS